MQQEENAGTVKKSEVLQGDTVVSEADTRLYFIIINLPFISKKHDGSFLRGYLDIFRRIFRRMFLGYLKTSYNRI